MGQAPNPYAPGLSLCSDCREWVDTHVVMNVCLHCWAIKHTEALDPLAGSRGYALDNIFFIE